MGRKRPAAEQGPRLPVLQNCNSLLAQTWEGLGEGAQGRVQEGMGGGGEMGITSPVSTGSLGTSGRPS